MTGPWTCPACNAFTARTRRCPIRCWRSARDALSAHYAAELGESFRTAGLCLYRDGRDSVAWHGDTIGRGSTEDTMVAIVSLGTARPLLLRPRAGLASAPGAARPPAGACGTASATGTCWSWAGAASAPGSTPIPKSANCAGPRISVQFRPRGVR